MFQKLLSEILLNVTGPIAAHEASQFEPLEMEVPQDLKRAPFDWSHAELGSLREVLVMAQRHGFFTPQPDLPL